MHKSSSHDNLSRISAAAQRAARAENWATVRDCTSEILKHDKRHPEAWFLTGLMEKAAGRNPQAVAAFSQSLQLDSRRSDAAIELANLCQLFLRNREAIALLQRYMPILAENAHYLDLAGSIYTRLGLHDKAWPLYRKANELQPDIDHFQENLAACATALGKTVQASELYHALLSRHPGQQRSHYHLACLERAQDSTHIEWMKQVLDSSRLPAEQNVYLYSAIAKELEDLGQWQESFDYYSLAADAAGSSSGVTGEIALIDRIIEVCNPAWLEKWARKATSKYRSKSPVFIVGFPGSDTRQTERIVASHSKVESADETTYLPMIIKRAGGAGLNQDMSPEIIDAAAKKEVEFISNGYLDAMDYRLHGYPMFTDCLPANFLYLGFIAKSFPDAQFIHVQRNPMDACFAMYKQPALSFAHSIDSLADYYLAHDRLLHHWRKVLGNRLIELNFDVLLDDPETQIRDLLRRLELDFEPACLEQLPETAAFSSWKNWESQLQPLKERLKHDGL